ncbi:unnamed protein product [Caenorhabditis nigoni]
MILNSQVDHLYGTAKAPPVLQFYADVEWDTLSLDSLVDEVKSNIEDKIKNDVGPDPMFFFKYEAFNEDFLLDVAQLGIENVYTATLPNLRPQRTFDRNVERQKRVEESLITMEKLFRLDEPDKVEDGLKYQYDAMMKRLPKCLKEDYKELSKNPQKILSYLLATDRCVRNTEKTLRNVIQHVQAIPASTAHVERSFSIVFHTRGPRRHRLSIKTLRSLMSIRINVNDILSFQPATFVHHWVRTGHRKLANTIPQVYKRSIYKFKKHIAAGDNSFATMNWSPDSPDQSEDEGEDEDEDYGNEPPPFDKIPVHKMTVFFNEKTQHYLTGSSVIRSSE